jgi:glycosyltransferase EpsE
MPPPRITFLIAIYNCRELLGECLVSLQQQTFPDWEAVACDDASSDGSWELLQEWSLKDRRIRPLRNKCNLGAAATRNRCLTEALGEYVVIQDADDISTPNRLIMLLDFLDSHPDCSFVSSGLFLFDEKGTYGARLPNHRNPQKRDFLFATPFCHATTMFRRKNLLAVGGYRVSRETTRGQDYDLFMRMYADGYVGSNIIACVYGYREGRAAYQRRKFRYRVDEMIIRYKGFRRLGLLPWALPYVLKPLAVAMIPASMLLRVKAWQSRKQIIKKE